MFVGMEYSEEGVGVLVPGWPSSYIAVWRGCYCAHGNNLYGQWRKYICIR
jgi:hypothetical protein